jgi:hypothetical protein
MKSARVVLLCGCLASAAFAADREFREIVDIISDEYGARPMRIPMFGLVKTVTYFARPAGAKHIDLAVFDDLGRRRSTGRNLRESIHYAVGPGWKPFIQVKSQRHGREELTLVYMRPTGKDWKILLTTIQPREATVVQLTVNMDSLERWLAEPLRSARNWNGKSDSRRADSRWDP